MFCTASVVGFIYYDMICIIYSSALVEERWWGLDFAEEFFEGFVFGFVFIAVVVDEGYVVFFG